MLYGALLSFERVKQLVHICEHKNSSQLVPLSHCNGLPILAPSKASQAVSLATMPGEAGCDIS